MVGWFAGFFQDTFPKALNQQPGPETVALLHLDCIYYESVLLALRTWYDRVAEGGVIVISDFGEKEGSRRAFYTFVAERGLAPVIHKIDTTRLWWMKGEEHTAGGNWYDSICYNPSPVRHTTRWERTTLQL